jgi:hypothetical protein
MLFQRVNRTDPERVFIVVRNSWSTATMTNGQWCAFDHVTDKDGVGVTKPLGVNRANIAGCLTQTIAHNDFGVVQNWGYKSDARCLGGTGSLTSKLTANSPLVFNTSGFAARNHARNSASLKSAWSKFPCGIAIEPLNTAAIATQAATSGQYEVFIRCL